MKFIKLLLILVLMGLSFFLGTKFNYVKNKNKSFFNSVEVVKKDKEFKDDIKIEPIKNEENVEIEELINIEKLDSGNEDIDSIKTNLNEIKEIPAEATDEINDKEFEQILNQEPVEESKKNLDSENIKNVDIKSVEKKINK